MNRIKKAESGAAAGAEAIGDRPHRHDETPTRSLIREVIEAHGGESRWHALRRLTAKVITGGFLFSMKGFETGGAPQTMTAELRRQRTRIAPFGEPDWHLLYEPDRVAIETRDGATIVEQRNPRATFAGHGWETPWTPAQLGYFSGYAIWTYFNLPFLLGEPGYESGEIPSIEQDGFMLKGLRVRFPENVHTHSAEQDLYFDESGLLRRQDYRVEIAGANPAAHLISDYIDVQGLKLPTRRRIFVRNEDGSIQPDKMPISLDVFDFRLE